MKPKAIRQDQNGPIAYSIAEASRVSSIGKTKLYQLIQEGRLEVRKVDRRTLVLAQSLIDLINASISETD